MELALSALLILLSAGCAAKARLSVVPRDAMVYGVYPDESFAQKLQAAEHNRAVIQGARQRDFDSGNGGFNDAGLALSGGGIRAAFLSLGVLRNLTERGLVQHFEYISSVSGGSYIMSWYMNQLALESDRAPLPPISLSSAAEFQHTIHNFQNGAVSTAPLAAVGQAGMAVKQRLFGMVGLAQRGRGGAANSYTKNLDETFLAGYHDRATKLRQGKDNKKAGGIKLEQFNQVSRPLFIYNATVKNSNSAEECDAIFEFNQRAYGNEAVGYRALDTLKSSACFDTRLSTLTGVSGAAAGWALYRQLDVDSRIPSPPNEKAPPHELKLTDGGHTENLGAFSLIKRGVGTIVIVDAEWDEYRFDAYQKLKHLLRTSLRLELSVPSIDQHLESPTKAHSAAYNPGVVRNLYVIAPNGQPVEKVIQVHYLKMTIPRTKLAEHIKRKIGEHSLHAYLQEQTRQEGKSSSPLQCSLRAAGYQQTSLAQLLRGDGVEELSITEQELERALAAHWVVRYSNFLNNHSLWRHLGYEFPQTTTMDQSYYSDQTAAFISLGYLIGDDLPASALRPETKG